MQIAFECSCGEDLEAASTSKQTVTEMITCADCEANFSVTVTLTHSPKKIRALANPALPPRK